MLILGRTAAGLTLALFVAIQALDHDFLPPRVSVSQYGIGPLGWLFTCWSALVASAGFALQASGPTPRRGGRWIAVGGSAMLVMGAVRTDAGGLQHSLHAKVHMAASIVALVALPIGLALAMSHAAAWWRRTAGLLVLGTFGSLIMVLVSAAGVATFRMDGAQSWALWQSVAVTLDLALVAVCALSTFSGRPAALVGRVR